LTAGLSSAAEYGVTVSAGEYNDYFEGASESLPVVVNWPAKITRVHLRLAASGVVSASGCISYTLSSMQNDQSTAPLLVDYAPTAHGPWRTLGRMPASWNGTQTCPVDANWAGHFGARLASAWYRERIAAGAGIEAAVSKPVHLRRTLSRVVDFQVSSGTVGSGGSLTVRGLLQQRTSHWRALSRQTVLIVLKPRGQSSWYWIRKVRTSASGHFTSTFTDPASATWSAVFEGGSRYFSSAARTVYVKVDAAAHTPAGGAPGLMLPVGRAIANLLDLTAAMRA
jgi:hypothetical protein